MILAEFVRSGATRAFMHEAVRGGGGAAELTHQRGDALVERSHAPVECYHETRTDSRKPGPRR